MRIYISGPMSGLPQFNVPLFRAAALMLRAKGYEVFSPAEMDTDDGLGEAIENNVTGDVAQMTAETGETWGTLLARDVKMLADGGIEAIGLLPGWQVSKGAKLEAYVGLLKNLEFFEIDINLRMIHPVARWWVLERIRWNT